MLNQQRIIRFRWYQESEVSKKQTTGDSYLQTWSKILYKSNFGSELVLIVAYCWNIYPVSFSLSRHEGLLVYSSTLSVDNLSCILSISLDYGSSTGPPEWLSVMLVTILATISGLSAAVSQFCLQSISSSISIHSKLNNSWSFMSNIYHIADELQLKKWHRSR